MEGVPGMPKLVIPGTLPGLNEYIDAERRNRHLGAKIKRQTQQVVVLSAKKCMRGFHPKRAVVMDYVWYEKNRRRDKDNVSSFGRKCIQDGLVQAGVLKNDGWAQIDSFSDAFVVDAKNPRVEVYIREVEPSKD